MKHGGKVEAVYNSKLRDDCVTGTCVLDFERGVANTIEPNVWQTDTCVGDWHYKRGIKYKTPKTVVDMLVDIVSRNGNLLLNFPLPNNGALDPEELKVLEGVTELDGREQRGDLLHSPVEDCGRRSGDGCIQSARCKIQREQSQRTFRAGYPLHDQGRQDPVRVPDGMAGGEAVVKPLGTGSPQNPPKIAHVQLLGYKGKVAWKQEADGLKVTLPQEKPSDYAVTLKVTTA